MQPITLACWSIKRIISVAAVTLAAALLAIAAVLYSLNPPPLLRNGFESTNKLWVEHHSLQESKQIVLEAAPLMLHCSIQSPPGDWYPLRRKYLLEVLNCAINLAQSDDPNAEYIIGWMYENGLYARPLDQLLQPLYEINLVDNKDTQSAAQWYERADSHGSPDAPLALGRLKQQGGSDSQSQKKEIVIWYEKAIARGNAEAKIDLGQSYEDLNTNAGAKRAMELYEEAAKAKSVYTVNNAVLHLLWLWKSNRAKPSAEFSRGKSNAFDFLSIFDPGLNSREFADFFTICGFVPDPYGQYRGKILPKIRHALGLSSASPAAPILSRGLKDSNQNVRDQSRSALEDLGDGAVIELTKLLSDRSSETRLGSLMVLAQLGKDAEPAVSRMIDLLVNDPDDRIYQEAKTAIRVVGPAAEPALIKLLNHPAARVRTDAAEGLAYVGTKAAVPALMKLLQAPEEAVFSATADTLGAIGQDATAAMPTLIEWLQFPDRDTRHRAAQHAICMNFKSSAVPALIRSLQSDAPESQRKQSARCLCNMGRDAEAAVPALIELTHTEHSPALRIYFVDALAWTGAHSHDAISALKLLAQKDQSPDIRHQAAMRLDEISKGIL